MAWISGISLLVAHVAVTFIQCGAFVQASHGFCIQAVVATPPAGVDIDGACQALDRSFGSEISFRELRRFVEECPLACRANVEKVIREYRARIESIAIDARTRSEYRIVASIVGCDNDIDVPPAVFRASPPSPELARAYRRLIAFWHERQLVAVSDLFAGVRSIDSTDADREAIIRGVDLLILRLAMGDVLVDIGSVTAGLPCAFNLLEAVSTITIAPVALDDALTLAASSAWDARCETTSGRVAVENEVVTERCRDILYEWIQRVEPLVVKAGVAHRARFYETVRSDADPSDIRIAAANRADRRFRHLTGQIQGASLDTVIKLVAAIDTHAGRAAADECLVRLVSLLGVGYLDNSRVLELSNRLRSLPFDAPNRASAIEKVSAAIGKLAPLYRRLAIGLSLDLRQMRDGEFEKNSSDAVQSLPSPVLDDLRIALAQSDLELFEGIISGSCGNLFVEFGPFNTLRK